MFKMMGWAELAPEAVELIRHFGAERDLLNLQCRFEISSNNSIPDHALIQNYINSPGE